jgi:DNA-directed RNA polymerase subunit RPC12/RpoP
MKYSEELESMIASAVEKGAITDQERNIIVKKALIQGVDPNELNLDFEARLAKKKKEQEMAKPVPSTPINTTKMGDVMKCPNCGEPYQPGTYKCESCGHIFQNIEANRASIQMAEGVQKLMNRKQSAWSNDKENLTREYIKNFPIPNTKDDILDFLLSLRAKAEENGYFQSSYEAKYKETLSKAKILFADDPQVQAAVKEVTQKKLISPQKKSLIIMGIFMLIPGVMFLLLIVILIISKLLGLEI